MIRSFNKENRENKDEDGFTLIDVLIGMAVFAIGFLALASMQVTATNSNTHARDLTQAVSLLENQIEELKNVRYDTDGMGTGLEITQQGDAPHQPATQPDPRYQVEWTVTNNAIPGIPNTLLINVTVNWESVGQSRQITYSFVKSQNIM